VTRRSPLFPLAAALLLALVADRKTHDKSDNEEKQRRHDP